MDGMIGEVWMGRRFFNGDELMGEGLIRFITWDFGNATRTRCGWDSMDRR